MTIMEGFAYGGSFFPKLIRYLLTFALCSKKVYNPYKNIFNPILTVSLLVIHSNI